MKCCNVVFAPVQHENYAVAVLVLLGRLSMTLTAGWAVQERQTFSLIKQSEHEASSLKSAVNYCLCNSVESASLQLKH